MRTVGLPLPVQAEPPEQVEDVVGERGNPQAVGIRHEVAAAHVRERERVLGFLEKVLHRPALAVGGNHFLHRGSEIRDDEHQRIREQALLLALVKLDLAHDAALTRPGLRLVWEFAVADEMRLVAPRGLCRNFVAKILHVLHQARILLQADDVTVIIGFHKVVKRRHRETAVAAQEHIRAGLIMVICFEHRLHELVSVLSTVVVPFAEPDADKVARQSVKNRDGMEADRIIVVDVRPAFLLPIRREQRRVHVQNDVFRMLALVREAQERPIHFFQLADGIFVKARGEP